MNSFRAFKLKLPKSEEERETEHPKISGLSCPQSSYGKMYLHYPVKKEDKSRDEFAINTKKHFATFNTNPFFRGDLGKNSNLAKNPKRKHENLPSKEIEEAGPHRSYFPESEVNESSLRAFHDLFKYYSSQSIPPMFLRDRYLSTGHSNLCPPFRNFQSQPNDDKEDEISKSSPPLLENEQKVPISPSSSTDSGYQGSSDPPSDGNKMEPDDKVKDDRKEGNFQCSYCQRSFSYLCHLKVHERVHTGEKPYSCKFCSQTFSQLGSLTVHMRIHTGAKPYQCGKCCKRFRHINSLRRHQRQVHAMGGNQITSALGKRSSQQALHFSSYAAEHETASKRTKEDASFRDQKNRESNDLLERSQIICSEQKRYQDLVGDNATTVWMQSLNRTREYIQGLKMKSKNRENEKDEYYPRSSVQYISPRSDISKVLSATHIPPRSKSNVKKTWRPFASESDDEQGAKMPETTSGFRTSFLNKSLQCSASKAISKPEAWTPFGFDNTESIMAQYNENKSKFDFNLLGRNQSDLARFSKKFEFWQDNKMGNISTKATVSRNQWPSLLSTSATNADEKESGSFTEKDGNSSDEGFASCCSITETSRSRKSSTGSGVTDDSITSHSPQDSIDSPAKKVIDGVLDLSKRAC